MLTFRDANREFGIIFLSILILIMYKRLSESEFTELTNYQNFLNKAIEIKKTFRIRHSEIRIQINPHSTFRTPK